MPSRDGGFEVRAVDGRLKFRRSDLLSVQDDLRDLVASVPDAAPFVLQFDEAPAPQLRTDLTEVVLSHLQHDSDTWIDATEDGPWDYGPRATIDDGLQPAFSLYDTDAEHLLAAFWANAQTFMLLQLDSPWNDKGNAENNAEACWFVVTHCHPDHGTCADSLYLLSSGVLLEATLIGEDTTYYRLLPAPAQPAAVANAIEGFITRAELFGAEENLLPLWRLGFPASGKIDPFPTAFIGTGENAGYEILDLAINPPEDAARILKERYRPTPSRNQMLLDRILACFETEPWNELDTADFPDWETLIQQLRDA